MPSGSEKSLGGAGVIESSMLRYTHMFPSDLLEEVETWDKESQYFFWAYVDRRVRQEMDKAILKAIEEGVMRGHKPLVNGCVAVSPTPFTDAERSIGPSKWFSGAERLVRQGV